MQGVRVRVQSVHALLGYFLLRTFISQTAFGIVFAAVWGVAPAVLFPAAGPFERFVLGGAPVAAAMPVGAAQGTVALI